MNAYEEGEMARRSGFGVETNPFDVRDGQNQEWLEGWWDQDEEFVNDIDGHFYP